MSVSFHDIIKTSLRSQLGPSRFFSLREPLCAGEAFSSGGSCGGLRRRQNVGPRSSLALLHPTFCVCAANYVVGLRPSGGLLGKGPVFTWGKGDEACLGHGEDLSDQLLPKKIEAWEPGQ